MLSFSSAPRPNILHRRDWYAVWIYTPLAQPRVLWHQKEDQSVLKWARQKQAREVAIINGGYFVPGPGSSHKIISEVSSDKQRWHHGVTAGIGTTPWQRWVVGWRLAKNRAPVFGLELMKKHLAYGFAPSNSFQRQYDYGFSGLLCLLRDGTPQVWRDEKARLHIVPPAQWKDKADFYGPYFRHAAIGWSADGKHLFLVVQHNPRGMEEMRDLFGRYTKKRYVGEGVLSIALRKAFRKLPTAERPCTMQELPRRIDNAVLLDGGHCASVIHRRQIGSRYEESGSWLTGTPGSIEAPRVPTMIEVTKP